MWPSDRKSFSLLLMAHAPSFAESRSKFGPKTTKSLRLPYVLQYEVTQELKICNTKSLNCNTKSLKRLQYEVTQELKRRGFASTFFETNKKNIAVLQNVCNVIPSALKMLALTQHTNYIHVNTRL